MRTFIQDFRYALRTIRRTPSFTVIVVLTLGLGIGANTAIFSLMDQVLLRRLPVKNPGELVQLDGPGPFSGRTMNDRTFSYPMYADLRDRNAVFSGLIGRFPSSATLTYRGQAERVDVELVSGNTFEVLGVSAALGRALTPGDDRTPGAHPVAVISHNYWQRRFAGSPAALNQVVNINSTPVTIVGVTRPGFAGIVATQMPDLFMPLMMKGQLTPTWNDLDNRRSRWVEVVGRLKPGLTAGTAKPQLDVVYAQINAFELQDVPAFAGGSQGFKDRFRAKTLTLHPAGRGLSGLRESVDMPLYVLMGMVGLVLLIACANVANLLLTRATARQPDTSSLAALVYWLGRSHLGLFSYLWQPVGGVLLPLAVLGGVCCWRTDRRPELLCLWLPVLMALAASFLHRWPFGGNQQMVFAAPAALLLAAEGIESLRRRVTRWHALPGWIIVVCVLLPGPVDAAYRISTPRLRHEVRPVLEFVQRNLQPDDQLLVFCPAEVAFYTGRDFRNASVEPDPSKSVWFIATGVGSDRFSARGLLDHLRTTRPRLRVKEEYGASAYLFGPERGPGTRQSP